MHTENEYKKHLIKYYYKPIMDNLKVENQVKKQLDNFNITFDFEGQKISKEDNEIIKTINKEVVVFKNKVRQKLNVEMYLKSLF